MAAWCSKCYESRLLAELIVVTDRLTGRQFYVCRPSVRIGCFRYGVRGVGLQTIALADPRAHAVERGADSRTGVTG